MRIYGKPLVYLDNAATTQKPQAVIDALVGFYTNNCANIHRGVHLLSEQATKAYEETRTKVKQFINAADEKEIIFVRGATEGINLVPEVEGKARLIPGVTDARAILVWDPPWDPSMMSDAAKLQLGMF